jgi:hypothetical protein
MHSGKRSQLAPHSPPLVDAMIPRVEQIVSAALRLVESDNAR